MSTIAFAALPDDARIWIFSASRPLEGNEAARLLQSVDAFLNRWVAHGRPVVGARDLRHGRFLLIAADERATGVSGCSIDSLFHTLQETERELDLSLLDPSRVDFRDANGEIRTLGRHPFRQRIRSGEMDENTPVFNHTITTVGELRRGEWEVPMKDSWHGRAFLQSAKVRGA